MAEKELVVADTLSRNLLVNVTKKSKADDVKAYVNAAVKSRPVSLEKFEQIKQVTLYDPQLSLVLKYTINEWQKYAKDVPDLIRQYYMLVWVTTGLSFTKTTPLKFQLLFFPALKMAALLTSGC